MKAVAQTFVGTVLVWGIIFAIDCIPGVSKTPQHPHALGDAGIAACAPEAEPALLCNAATKTVPAHECVICPDPARHCFTQTGVYCATSCDEPLCERRK